MTRSRRARGPLASSVPVALVVGLLVAGCSNYADLLQRGQGYYEQTEYERALSVWRHLDREQRALGPSERVRFYYLRGMTDYRLGYRSHARYWLGLAKVAIPSARTALAEEEVARLDDALDDLGREVYGLKPREQSQVLGDQCKWTSECESGFVCTDGVCILGEAGDAPAYGVPYGPTGSPSETQLDPPLVDTKETAPPEPGINPEPVEPKEPRSSAGDEGGLGDP